MLNALLFLISGLINFPILFAPHKIEIQFDKYLNFDLSFSLSDGDFYYATNSTSCASPHAPENVWVFAIERVKSALKWWRPEKVKNK